MKFVDLINDQKPWTKAQLRRRLQAHIRSKFQLEDELKLARIGVAHLMVQMNILTPEEGYTLTQDDMALLKDYGNHVKACLIAYEKAKADNALLTQVIEYEKALNLISRCEDENGEPTIEQYRAITLEDGSTQMVETEEWKAYQAAKDLVANTTQEVIDLYTQRHPVEEDEKETT